MFVDASAIVAILTREPEADILADTEHDLAPSRYANLFVRWYYHSECFGS